MANYGNCLKCGSDKIIPNARILSKMDYGYYSGDVHVEVYKDPYAFLFKGAMQARLRAWICGDCGYVELYTERPGELYSVYRQSEMK